MEAEETQVPVPRRSMRRFALSEVNEPGGTPTKSQSPEERVIIQRGRRCKPLIWSPLDYDRNKFLQKSAGKTPQQIIRCTELISSRLKRRLILSPTKSKSQSKELGSFIANKIKLIDKKGEQVMTKKLKVNDKHGEDMKNNCTCYEEVN